MSLSSLKLHNAMWPGLIGKGDDEGQEPPSASRICSIFRPPPRWTEEFDGIDYFLSSTRTPRQATTSSRESPIYPKQRV